MENRDKIELCRKKIVADPLFASSGRNIMLLDYLITKALEGEFLKEYTIGSDLFKNNYKTDHNDGIVRVHIYNLRKRLKQYYQTTGADDAVQFLIPKGDYNVQFVYCEEVVKRQYQRKYIAIIATIVAVIFALAIYFTTRPHYYCWQNFIDGNFITNCVIADQVVMQKHCNGVISSISNPSVVTRNDFVAFSQNNPSDSLTLLGYTTYTKAIPHSVQRLTQWFSKHNKNFNLINESEFSIQDYRTANTLYIGQFKVMNLSHEIFLKNSKKFGIANNNFCSFGEDGKQVVHHTIFAKGKRETEYAIVSYFPMEGGFDALYFTSNNDIGTMVVVSKFIDPKFLKEFYKQLPSEKSYFNALFKIEGINRTDLNCELANLEVVE